MTARRLERRGGSTELRLITPEAAPLAIFGAVGSAAVTRELDDAGVAFSGSAVALVRGDEQVVVEVGPRLAAVRRRPGRRAAPDVRTGDRRPVRRHRRLPRHRRAVPRPVHAPGLGRRRRDQPDADGRWACGTPGGLRGAVDRGCGRRAAPAALVRPVAPGAAAHGPGSLWLQRDVSDPADPGVVGDAPLWSPPGKIAARRLGALLAAHDVPGGLARPA